MQSLLAAVAAHTSRRTNSASSPAHAGPPITLPSAQTHHTQHDSDKQQGRAHAMEGREYSVTRSALPSSSSSQLRESHWDPCSSLEASRIDSGVHTSESPLSPGEQARHLSRPPSSADHLTDMMQQTSLVDRSRTSPEPMQNPYCDRQPHPALAPEDVIEIQLGAMKYNDFGKPDGGIEICFRFASPANRVFTGPVARFARMMHSPLYGVMLAYDALQFVPANAAGNRWKIHITKGDTRSTFLWTLSKQTVAPFQDCWMTDNVLLLQE